MSDEHEHEHNEAEEFNPLAGISEEDHERWHRFMDAVGTLAEEHFPEDMGGISFVMGGQFGGLGQGDAPNCIMASNLVPCATLGALEDMVTMAEAVHDNFHGTPHRTIEQQLPLDSVPEEIRAKAVQVAEMLGVPVESIRYVEVADVDDLDALPLFEGDLSSGDLTAEDS